MRQLEGLAFTMSRLNECFFVNGWILFSGIQICFVWFLFSCALGGLKLALQYHLNKLKFREVGFCAFYS